MELREVRSFVTLAEQLHFGRAARVLAISQPALTKQIHRLEEELGGALLSRGRHGARLTPLGAEFLTGARALVHSSDELVAVARRTARGDAGRLRIGFGFHTLELVPRLIVRLRKSRPDVVITLRDMSTVEQLDALRSDKLDLGFVRLPVARDLETRAVIDDRLMLVSPASEALPSKVTLGRCRDQPFVLLSQERSPTFHAQAVALCTKHGFHPRVVQTVPEVTTAVALVRAGLGLTMIPQSFGTAFAGVRFHRLDDKEARWSVGAAWRKGDHVTNGVLQRFLSLLGPSR